MQYHGSADNVSSRWSASSGAAADHLSAPPRLGGFVSGAVRGFANPVPKKLVVKI